MYARYRRLSVHTKRWGKVCSFWNRSWYQDTQRIVVFFFKRFGLYSWPRYLTLRNCSLDKVFTQRLNIFEEKCIFDKKKTHYEPTETFLDTHSISLFLKKKKKKQLPYKVEPLIILTNNLLTSYYLRRKCCAIWEKIGNKINRERLCAAKQHEAASEKAVKTNLAYRDTIQWNLDITKGQGTGKVSLYRGSFPFLAERGLRPRKESL